MADYGAVGGPGGVNFDDSTDLGLEASSMRIIALIIHSDPYIFALTPIYVDGKGKSATPKHGDNGGVETRVNMDPDEFITEISGRSSKFIDSLIIETNKGKRIGFGGAGGGPVPAGYQFPPATDGAQEVFAFFGRAGKLVDAIGIHTRPAPKKPAPS